MITGKFFEAEKNYKEALRMFKAKIGTEIEQARCLMNLGTVYYSSTDKFPETEENYKEALRMLKAKTGTEIDQARCLMGMGILYIEIQEYSKARSMLESALDIYERYPMGTEQIENACLELLSQIP